MKKIYIFLILIVLFACKKDETKIKEIRVQNPGMQAFLIGAYDKNHDGKLSEEEALEVTAISVPDSQEEIDGLENFPNLEILYLPREKFIKMDEVKI